MLEKCAVRSPDGRYRTCILPLYAMSLGPLYHKILRLPLSYVIRRREYKCFSNTAQELPRPGRGGGGVTPHMKGERCSSEILNYTPKGDRSGRGPSFFGPLKETMLKHRQYDIYLYFSRATLNETFTAKYDGVLPRTP